MEAKVSAEIKLNTNQFRRLRAACQWSARDIGDLDEYAATVSLAIRQQKNINSGRRQDASRRGAAPAREEV